MVCFQLPLSVGAPACVRISLWPLQIKTHDLNQVLFQHLPLTQIRCNGWTSVPCYDPFLSGVLVTTQFMTAECLKCNTAHREPIGVQLKPCANEELQLNSCSSSQTWHGINGRAQHFEKYLLFFFFFLPRKSILLLYLAHEYAGYLSLA